MLNALTGVLGQGLSFVLSFALRSVFIQTLGETYLGLNGLYSNILDLLNLTELGLGTATVIELYRTEALKDEEKTLQYLALYKKAYRVIGTVILVMGLALTPFLEYLIKDHETIQLVDYKLLFLLYLFNTVLHYYIFASRGLIVTANQEEYRTRVFSFFQKTAEIITQIFTLFLFRNLYLYVFIPFVFNWIGVFFVKGYMIPKWYPFIRDKPRGKLSKEELTRTRKNVLSVAVYKVSGKVIHSTDNILLSAYISIILTGLYSNYLILVSAVRTILEKIFSSVAASLGNLNVAAGNDYEKKYQIFRILNFLNFWLYGYCAVCLYTMFTPFITLWIGERFVFSEATEFVIVLNLLVAGLQETVPTHRGSYGLFYQGRFRPIFSVTLNIVSSLFFILTLPAEYGVIAVLLGTILSNICVSWWYDALIVFKYAFHRSPAAYYLHYWLRMFYCVGMCLLCRMICNQFSWSPLGNTILAFLISTIIFHGAFIALFHKYPEFHDFTDYVKHLLRK